MKLQMIGRSDPQGQSSLEKTKEIARFTTRRGRGRKAVLLLAVLVAAGGIFWRVRASGESVPQVNVTELSRGELVRQISLTGRLESEESARVYSNQSESVQAVLVRVGDRVEEGEILAQLDGQELERDLGLQRAAFAKSAREAELNLEASREEYDNMLRDLKSGSYTELVKANQNLNRAMKKYTEARSDFEDHRDELDHADEEYDYLDRKMTRTKIEMDRAQDAYDAAVREGDSEKAEAARQVLSEKEAAYNEARDNWEKAYDDKSEVYNPITITYRDARLSYLEAMEDQKLAERDAQRTLDSLKRKVELGELGQDLSSQQAELERLQRSLADCTVKAPVSGVVTAVYAKEGMPGNGLLFVIEDTDRLRVRTEVKEYDVASLQVGMESIVKSDALGDQSFEGRVSRIAPASVKDANGETKTENSASYETEISLVGAPQGLRIGMKVRLNVVLERREGVFSVPYEAVTTGPDGKSVIYLLQQEGKTSDSGDPSHLVARAVEVETGMETDFLIEVRSPQLQEGDQVASDPTGLLDGMAVTIADQMVG